MRPVLLLAVLAAGCTPPSIVLQFPDKASETESTELTVYAMAAGTDCGQLMRDGTPNTWLNAVTAKLPLTEPAHLGRVAKGPAVFFAEVRNAAMETILRACAGATSGSEISLVLHRVPTPIAMREGEVRDLDLTALDDSGAAVTLVANGLPLFATFDAATHHLHLAPGFADQGTHLITLAPTSTAPGTFTQRIDVTVADVPRPLKWDRLYRGFHGRFDAAALWDGQGKQLLISGGRDRGIDLSSSSLYSFSAPADVLGDYRAVDLSGPVGNWGNRKVIRTGSTTKFGHVMGWLKTPSGQRLAFVLGGSDGAQVSPESLFIDVNVPLSSTISPSDLSGPPVFLTGMSTAIEPDESKTYLFGGDLGLGTYYNDVRTVSVGNNDTSLLVSVLPIATQGRPAPRTQAAMVMALNPRRLVVIGGRNLDLTPSLLSDAWVLCLEVAQPKCPVANFWFRVVNTGDTFPGPAADPSAGVFALAAGYDAPRDRVLTFGGLGKVSNGAYLFEDTFELDLSASVPDGGTVAAPFRLLPPAADGGLLGLVGAASAQDSDGGRLLLYGGITGRFLNGQGQLDLLEDVWSLGLTPGNERLTKIPVTGLTPFPQRRGGAALTSRPPLVMFGGDGEDTQPLDEWRINGDGGVTQVMTPGTSPLPRATMGMVYNPDTDEHWLYGGRLMSLLPVAQLFRLRRDAGWSALDEPLVTQDGGDVQPRFAQATVYDQQNKRLILFGGVGVAGLGMGGSLNDVKAIEVLSETVFTHDLAPAGSLPAPRYGSIAGYDRAGQRMIIFGGTANFSGSEADTRETWQLSLVKGAERWSKIEPKGIAPEAMYFPVGVLTKENPPVLYVVGSIARPPVGQPHFVDALWKLKLEPGNEEWISLGLPDFRPGPRLFASVAYDDIGNRLLYAAGAFDPVFRNDVWALTLP